jgi:TP901-1 family phage major tail protein
VDVTNADSAGRWRELLAGAGVRRAALSGAGVFKDEAADARLRTLFFDGVIEAFQLVLPAFGVVEGPFQITSLEYRGDHAGEVTFDMALESAGALTFTAL